MACAAARCVTHHNMQEWQEQFPDVDLQRAAGLMPYALALEDSDQSSNEYEFAKELQHIRFIGSFPFHRFTRS